MTGQDVDVERRRDEALARLLKMPPKPHEDMKLGKPRRKEAAYDGHWSSCAVHNEPAYPAGPCDCGGFKPEQGRQKSRDLPAYSQGEVQTADLAR